MNINYIIFDLGAVLIEWNPYPVILKSFNNDPDQTNWFFQNIATHELNLSLDKGLTFADAKVKKTREFPEYANNINAYFDNWREMLGNEISDSVQILKTIYQSKKYKLYSITNWSFETFPIALKKFPFLKWFNDIVVSGKVKMVKPDPEIYLYSIDRFNIEDPNQAVFIDDRLDNIETARKIGINGIHFKNPSQLSIELKKYGVNHL